MTGVLQAGTTPQEAWAYAELMYEEVGDLSPEQAAEASALALPAKALGAF